MLAVTCGARSSRREKHVPRRIGKVLADKIRKKRI